MSKVEIGAGVAGLAVEKAVAGLAVDKATGEIVNRNEFKFDPSKVVPKKRLNLSVLSQKGKATIYVTMLSKIFVGKMIDEKVEGDKKKDPAHIAFVYDLVGGQPVQIILSTVQQGTLEENYPDHSYVGKSFQFENLGKLNGKDYNTVNVIEIDTPPQIDFEAIKATLLIPS